MSNQYPPPPRRTSFSPLTRHFSAGRRRVEGRRPPPPRTAAARDGRLPSPENNPLENAAGIRILYRMSNPRPSHPIADSLRRREILYVCHMTPCHRLPSIFAAGGLLSLAARREMGVAEPERPHDWGGDDKREALAGYVVCGFETPKWMCGKHPEELAVIILDAYAVCCREGALFCPGNSADDRYPASDIATMSGVKHFDRCFKTPLDRKSKFGEILVPGQVPVENFRGLLFCDREASDYWLPQIEGLFPHPPLTAAIRYLWSYKFPVNWNPSERRHP